MYHDWFDLDRSPFSIAPDPHFLYMSERHREALAHLLWGLKSEGGFVLLTGEVGTGKTTLSRCLLEQIEDDTDLAFIINPKVTANEMLATICDELGVPVPEAEQDSSRRLVEHINHRLLAAHAERRRTVLVIDEAQNLATDVLEQIRLLTNLETNERKLLQVILIGQPELAEMLRRPELRQLAQRITARYHLAPLGAEELGALVQHRMNVAGARRNPFAPRALRLLHRRSGGIPRLANVIADRALLGAFAEGSERVTARIVGRAASEVLGESAGTATRPWPILAGIAVLAVVALLSILVPNGGLPERTRSAGGVDGPGPAAGASAPGVAAATVHGNGDSANPAIGTSVSGTSVSGITDSSAADSDTVLAPAARIEGRVEASAEASADDSGAPGPSAADARPAAAADPDGAAAAPIPVSLDALGTLSAPVTRAAAASAMLEAWRTPLALVPGADICGQVAAVGLGCLEWNGDWPGLLRSDRPALLMISAPTDLGERHLALLGIGGGMAMVGLGAQRYQLPLDELERRWLGRATLFWQLPPAYRQPTRIGDRSATVDWLRNRLETLAGRAPLAPAATGFDEVLEAQVRAFQLREGLLVDGVAGPETWMRINTLTDVGVPSLRGGVQR